jgi:hypothetical protein
MVAMIARVSELETFRRWREDEEATLEDILPKLQGGFVATARMDAGSAFHKALELSEPGEFDLLQAEHEGQAYVFHFDTDAEIELPNIRELRHSKTFHVEGGTITVSGQVDSLLARRVDDHKTTAQMDAEGYFAGYQWRSYLTIFEANTFRWNVFEIREASERFLDTLPADRAALPGQHYVVHGAHRLEQHRYPGMEADVERLAADFYRFALAHLPERFTAEAA